jgi:orotidine-5'-phosphate decarboxylase
VPSPLIIALDLADPNEAQRLVDQLGDEADFYKVGLELYTAAGSSFVRALVDQGKKVFLDLKMYDIGETVKRAVSAASQLGVTFLTVHGSRAVMEAAVAGKQNPNLQLLAVTVLTSYDAVDLADLGYSTTPAELVSLRVSKAAEAGVDGIVCSPLEVAAVRQQQPKLVLVTPGVRSVGAATGDQKRVATPKQAIADGANYLVIGRQVTRASDPSRELRKLIQEIATSGN